ncbi:hypothetical protein Q31b_21770 [Novipirellula aureliae]|uniref:Uncharacterized protein n=1 Tax=Novipirellula aureliae TaxID=2527966 RepID=A0A5C6E7E8_9BACT|nr:hypothetical protein [Novipirellula aureliae]TWU43139.1 hypothetical protein Q31b_21770 [Novipirellula aureliae]
MRRLALFLLFVLVGLMLMPRHASAQRNQITLQLFYQWVFQGQNGLDAGMKSLENSLESELIRLELQIPLSEAQKQKIRLAGQVDIKRFLDRLDLARDKFMALSTSDVNDNQVINEAYQIASPLGREWSVGLFGDQSFVQKVVSTALNAEQLTKVEAERQRLLKQNTETVIRVNIATLGRSLLFSEKQRDFLMQYCLENIPPFDTTHNRASMLLEYHFAQIPEQQIKDYFDEVQAKALLERGKRFGADGNKQMLIREGLLNDE